MNIASIDRYAEVTNRQVKAFVDAGVQKREFWRSVRHGWAQLSWSEAMAQSAMGRTGTPVHVGNWGAYRDGEDDKRSGVSWYEAAA